MLGGPSTPSTIFYSEPPNILQVDGNISIIENDFYEENFEILTQIGHRPDKVIYERPPSACQEDNKM